MPETVHIVVPEGYTWFFIQNPPHGVDELLDVEMSYFEDGAEHSDAYRRGNWDGRKRLYDTENHGAPVGLLGRARSIIEQEGYDVAVTVEGDRSGDEIAVSWNFPHDLRDHQQQAVGDVLAAGGGVVACPTGGGKTAIALRLIESIGQRAIVFVHTKELLYQWADRIRDVHGVEPGVIGDGKWSEGPITVAIMQTLVSRGVDELSENYDVAIFDECHRSAAAEKFHKIGMGVDVEWSIGLSATPWRTTDGAELKIEGAVGGVASTVTAADLIDAGYLAEPLFRVVDPADYGQVPIAKDDETWHDVYERCVVEHPGRNRAIAKKAGGLAVEGYTVLATVDRIDHGELLEEMLTNHGAVFLCGEDSSDRRQDVLDDFESGDIPILISTLIKEGVDLPELNAVVLAEGKKSDITRIQEIGRALRPAGGDHAIIYDVRDRGKYLGEHFEERQKALSKYYEAYGPDEWHPESVRSVRDWRDGRGVDVGKLTIYDDPARARVVWTLTEYLGDEWDHYQDVMQSTRAIKYDGQVNYVRDPDRLPDPAQRGVA